MSPPGELAKLECEFAAYALEQAHPLIKALRADHLEADLRKATRDDIALLGDEEAACKYAEAMKALALPPEFFKARLIEIDGYRFLARINFSDLSGALPFVRILRASTSPGTIADRTVWPAVASEFAIFQPRRIRFYHSAHLPLGAQTACVDHYFLAASAREMAARSPACGLERVTLHCPSDLSFYSRYAETYARMFSARPQLHGHVPVETEETLAECHRHGLLYEIVVDGKWAGIVAVRREIVAGVKGFLMVEIVLDEFARGQGLGPAVHQRLAAEIAACDPTGILTGTIAAINEPSLKTATRAGRTTIGAWYRFEW